MPTLFSKAHDAIVPHGFAWRRPLGLRVKLRRTLASDSDEDSNFMRRHDDSAVMLRCSEFQSRRAAAIGEPPVPRKQMDASLLKLRRGGFAAGAGGRARASGRGGGRGGGRTGAGAVEDRGAARRDGEAKLVEREGK